MGGIIEFFKGLLATDQWPARWHCGYWSNFHGWLFIISDLLIWAAYFMIPVIIINYIIEKKTDLKFNKAYIYFAAFILLCGTTHFFDAMMFWVPMYRLNALIRMATAVISLFTVYYLIKILPDAFRQKTYVELEKEIALRKIAENKMQESNRGLEAFAYIASHDLQEPLRKISTFSSILFDLNQSAFDEKSKQLAEKITSSTVRMQTMINDVLSLSTLSEETPFTTVDVADAVHSAMLDLEIKRQEKSAVIHIGELPPVHGNKAYLGQLFLNLISNSLKFSKSIPHIEISGEKAGDKVRISVSDNGIGMNPEDLNTIFNAFQRLNPRAEYEGSGIGLAICRKIVQIHKGKIEVKSTPGTGTTFIIELPAATDQS
jgi:two-component system, chemotaxis family, sensor kinase Cph1